MPDREIIAVYWAKLLNIKHRVGLVKLRVFATGIERFKMIPK
jgi:hypothetical protein